MKAVMAFGPIRRICVFTLLLVVPVSFTACSTAKKIPEYRQSQLLPPLEIPSNLDKPVYNERMKIPEAPAASDNTTGDDVTSVTRSIEEPPEFIEEDDSTN
jgi:hypothetical protein